MAVSIGSTFGKIGALLGNVIVGVFIDVHCIVPILVSCSFLLCKCVYYFENIVLSKSTDLNRTIFVYFIYLIVFSGLTVFYQTKYYDNHILFMQLTELIHVFTILVKGFTPVLI